MGYTHYWNIPISFNNNDFRNFAKECSLLIRHAPKKTTSAGGFYKDSRLELAGWDGNGMPLITDDTVSFNGLGKLSHETFLITSKCEGFGFCKTARKPYDLLVVACLESAKKHLKAEVSSDGSSADLRAGKYFYKKIIEKYGQ